MEYNVAGRAAAVRAFAAIVLLMLTGCASEPSDDGAGRTIAMPLEWDDVDLAEADLTLPLITPMEIARLRKRVGEGQAFENLYTFHGLHGYVLTSRIAFGSYTARFSKTLRSSSKFKLFAEDLSLPPGGRVSMDNVRQFSAPDPETRGHYGHGASRPYHDRCFVARIGYALVDYSSFEREADAVDTIVEVLLCGHLPDETVLLDFLAALEAVEDREAFRRELSRRPIGTI